MGIKDFLKKMLRLYSTLRSQNTFFKIESKFFLVLFGKEISFELSFNCRVC